MMKTARSSAASGPQFQALKMACADYPGGHTLPAAERLQLVLQPVGWSAPSANHILAAVELRTAYRGVIGRATHERGPPFTLQSL